MKRFNSHVVRVGLLALLGVAVLVGLSLSDEKKVQETVAELPAKKRYVNGEVLVKFKSSSLRTTQEKRALGVTLDKQAISYDNLDQAVVPLAMKTLNSNFRIKTVEKVFKGKQAPLVELLKLSSSTRALVDEKAFLETDLSRIYKLTFEEDAPIEYITHKLMLDANIEFAEPNMIFRPTQFTPNDPYFNKQWALLKIDAPNAWAEERGSSDIVIAVIDTGIDYTHPDLGGCTSAEFLAGSCAKVVDGDDVFNFGSGDVDPMDEDGHGTHVAGIAAANGHNELGITGVCPNCSLMALKFMGDIGDGEVGGTTAGAIAAIEYIKVNALDDGTRVVVNNSWGALETDFLSDILQAQINAATSMGGVFIAAAGNEGNEDPVYPAVFNNVFSVASSDYDDVKSGFSTYGTWVDITAPGGDVATSRTCAWPDDIAIFSTMADGPIWDLVGPDCRTFDNVDGRYMSAAGTSMATPHVSGLAGLILSQHPTWTASQVFSQIRNTADNIDSENPSLTGKLGAGRINARRALTETQAEPDITIDSLSIDDSGSTWPNGMFEPGESVEVTIDLINGGGDAASQISAALTSSDSFVTINQGQSNYPDLAVGDVDSNTTLYEVSLSSSAPAGHNISLSLAVAYENSSGDARSANLSTTYIVTEDLGWPKAKISDDHNRANSIIFADLDQDGETEVLFTTRAAGSYVRAYTNDGHLIWSFNVSNDENVSGASLSAGNLDSDDALEVVFTTTGPADVSTLYVMEHTGQVKTGWPETISTSSIGIPTLVDLDGDDVVEILVGVYGSSSQAIRVYDSSKTLVFSRSGSHDLVLASAVGNLDNDDADTIEIVTGFTTLQGAADWSTTILTSNADGSDFGTTINLSDEHIVGRPPVLADIDNDGDLEIIVASRREAGDADNAARVHVFDMNGDEMTGWPKELDTVRLVGVADVDDDEELELFVNENSGGRFHGWNHDGSNLNANWPVTDSDVGGYNLSSSPVIGDIDADGSMELLFNVNSCRLIAFNADDGARVIGYPITLSADGCDAWQVVIGNLGNDPSLQIGVTAEGEDIVYLIDTDKAFNENSLEWPAYLHDAQHTNNYNTGIPFDTPPNGGGGDLVADAGGDQEFFDTRPDGICKEQLDGSGSTGTIASYEWTWEQGGNNKSRSGVTPTLDILLGTHEVTLTITDSDGNSDSDTVTVTCSEASSWEPKLLHGELFEGGNLAGWERIKRNDENYTGEEDDITVPSGTGYESDYALSLNINNQDHLDVREGFSQRGRNRNIRFLFNPNSIDMADGDQFFLLTARNDNWNQENQDTNHWAAIRVSLRKESDGYVLLVKPNGDNKEYSRYSSVPISDGWHVVHLRYQSSSVDGADDGSFRVRVDGELVANRQNLDTDTIRIDKIYVAAWQVEPTTSGSILYDGIFVW